MPNSEYISVLSKQAVAFIVNLASQKQIKVLDIADRIAFAPERISDISQPDAEGRLIESVLIDEFLFTYWVDHAAREVQITEINEA